MYQYLPTFSLKIIGVYFMFTNNINCFHEVTSTCFREINKSYRNQYYKFMKLVQLKFREFVKMPTNIV